jgi:hypothetical protein
VENNSGFEKLKDSNWGTWKVFMKALLVRKQLWDYVDGSEEIPVAGANNRTGKAVRTFRKKQAEAVARSCCLCGHSSCSRSFADHLLQVREERSLPIELP